MPALYLSEEQVASLLDMGECIRILGEAFQALASGGASNLPRQRIRVPGSGLQVMPAGYPARGFMGYKAYTAGSRMRVFLYSAAGEMLAILGANALGAVRTGAASGLATRHMARPESGTVGIIGTGTQARTQLEAVCQVLQVREVRAFSRNPERRAAFAREMSVKMGVAVAPSDSAEEAARYADVVIAITNSRDPVLEGSWLAPGCHINAAGSNSYDRRELDEEAVRRSDVIVVDALDQARLECGDLLAPAAHDAFHWEDVHPLARVVGGQVPGRRSPAEITLFESQGLAIEDVATAAWVYERARARGLGVELPF